MIKISNVEVSEQEVEKVYKNRLKAAIGMVIFGFLCMIPNIFVQDAITLWFLLMGIILFLSGIFILIIWHGILREKAKRNIKKELEKKKSKNK